MTPERIYGVLTTGVMQAQSASLSAQAKRAIAEYLGDRKLGASESGAADQMPNRCEPSSAPRRTAGRDWNGWGADLANTRYQPATAGALPAVQVPRLALRWAFDVTTAAER